MEILGIDRGWVGNECGPDRRVGHGYDRIYINLLSHRVTMKYSLPYGLNWN